MIGIPMPGIQEAELARWLPRLGLAAVLGYLLGAIPSAVWVTRTRGLDIFTIGSANMGAMNVARNVGWGFGVLVLLLDAGKAALAMGVGWLCIPAGYTLADVGVLLPLCAGFFAIVGHIFSIWVGFRGGKALSSSFGLYLFLLPLAALSALACLVLLIVLSRRVVRGTLMMCVCYPGIIGLYTYRAGWQWQWCVLQAACIGVLVAAKHWHERHNDPLLW